MKIRAWERDTVAGKGIETLVNDALFLAKITEYAETQYNAENVKFYKAVHDFKASGATATFDELKQRCDDIWRTHIEPEDPSTNLEVCTTAKQKKKMRDTRVAAEEGSAPGDDEKNTVLKTYEPAMKGVVRMINTTIIHGFINEPTYENYLSERFPLPEAYIRRFQTAGGAPPTADLGAGGPSREVPTPEVATPPRGDQSLPPAAAPAAHEAAKSAPAPAKKDGGGCVVM